MFDFETISDTDAQMLTADHSVCYHVSFNQNGVVAVANTWHEFGDVMTTAICTVQSGICAFEGKLIHGECVWYREHKSPNFEGRSYV